MNTFFDWLIWLLGMTISITIWIYGIKEIIKEQEERDHTTKLSDAQSESNHSL